MAKHHRIIVQIARRARGWVMKPLWRAAVMLMCGWTGAFAQTAGPTLPSSAFVVPQPCRVDPYGDASPEQREQELDRQCGLDRLQMRVDGPRVQPTAVAMNTPKFELDQLVSRNDGPLINSLRMGWAATLDDKVGKLETEHALVAAGSQLRLGDDWALDMNVGRDVGAKLPRRTTFTGLWRPAGESMMFAQLAPEASGLASTVGMRWWLVPKRLVLDVAAHRSADGQSIEPRVGLSVLQFGR
jgi:hypothetical protein